MEQLDKITKKCQQRNKLAEKKSSEYRIKKNKSMNEAWIRSQQLSHDLIEYQQSKNASKYQKPKTKTSQDEK